MLKENEMLCDLGLGGLKLIQGKTGFRFGTDSVLLSDFAKPHRFDRIVDLGSGSGILGFLLLGRHKNITIHALEIDSLMVDRCRRSIELNSLEKCFELKEGDIRNIKDYYEHNAYQMVVSNPPYFSEKHASLVSESQKTARTDEGACFDDIASAAKHVLNTGGRLISMCPSSRLFEMSGALKNSGFCIKRLRFVRSFKEKEPYLVLFEARLYAKEGVIFMPDLVVYNENREYTDELKKIYHLS